MLGKIPTTSVRRLISLLTRSRGLVDQILRQCASGKSGERGDLLAGVAEHVGDRRARSRRACRRPCRRGRAPAAGSAGRRSVRTAAATISALALGTLASTLRMKWTRHRCQDAPEHGRLDRVHQAAVGVGDHQLDPAQAARVQAAQELGPEHLGLAVADRGPEHLAAPVGADAGGDHDGLGDHPPADPGLAVGRVEEHVREVGVVQRPARGTPRPRRRARRRSGRPRTWRSRRPRPARPPGHRPCGSRPRARRPP